MGLDLLARSGLPTEVRAGVVLLAVSHALRLVELARAENLTILGIEGFHVRGGSISPLTDWIADFSGVVGGSRASEVSCDSAGEFLRSLAGAGLGEDVRVEVTLTS